MAQSLPDIKYAGFWIRLAAGLLDNIVISIILGMLGAIGAGLLAVVYGPNFYLEGSNTFISFLILIGVLATHVIYYLYCAILESSPWQATIGMKVFRLKITNYEFKRISFWRAVGRELCTILSGFLLYIGYFMIAFTKKKQGLHDIIADTYVIRE